MEERHRLGQSEVTAEVRADVAEPPEGDAASVGQDGGSTRIIALRSDSSSSLMR